MGGARKGSAFERWVSKDLSKWWTRGARDDVFWRSSQSGGRATIRSRSGLSTSGSYGDISAIDPDGLPLLRLWTIELKRGKSHGNLLQLIETGRGSVDKAPFVKTLRQASSGAKAAGSVGWMLIVKQDFKEPLVCVDGEPWPLENVPPYLFEPRVMVKTSEFRFLCVPYEVFFRVLRPDDVRMAEKACFLRTEKKHAFSDGGAAQKKSMLFPRK